MIKDEKKLNELVNKFRESYKLPKELYPDEIIKYALVNGKGDFSVAFADLMSFIE